jgi:hypothetical protein
LTSAHSSIRYWVKSAVEQVVPGSKALCREDLVSRDGFMRERRRVEDSRGRAVDITDDGLSDEMSRPYSPSDVDTPERLRMMEEISRDPRYGAEMEGKDPAE